MTEISVCTDCIQIIANGDCGENTDTHADAMIAYSPNDRLILGGEELGFSYSHCEACGDHLAGDRFLAYAEND